MSKKSPQLRFEGFTDDWEERKLNENVENIGTGRSSFKAGLDYSEQTPYEVLGSTSVISYSDSFDHSGNFVLTARVGANAGNLYKHSGNLKISDNTVYIQSKNLEFIFYLLTKYDLKKLAFGTGQPLIKASELKNLKLFFPKKFGEQQKIGSFFKQLDETIALHQRKLDLLKEQKKGYLQKMFPKNGAKVPELRFAGFADDWEQRKLNEVSDIYDGTHQTPKYQDDGVMFLSVENIKTLTSNKFISREAFEDEFKIRPQRGDVLMTRIGDIGTANVVETDEDLAYYVSLALFKSEELNPYFLQASIYAPSVQDQIWKRTLHIAFPKKINKNEIGQVPINVPTLAEQTKIGSFFKQLDDTIALIQRKLDLLKEQKKGFLQKMFV